MTASRNMINSHAKDMLLRVKASLEKVVFFSSYIAGLFFPGFDFKFHWLSRGAVLWLYCKNNAHKITVGASSLNPTGSPSYGPLIIFFFNPLLSKFLTGLDFRMDFCVLCPSKLFIQLP